MRTFDRETYLRSEAEWKDFGWEWQRIRRQAAERGFILAPHGTAHDDRDAENPSQRAIIYRALQDNPKKLEGIIARSNSWSQVVDGIIGLEERLRQEADERTRDDAWGRQDEPTGRDATMTLKGILNRIGDFMIRFLAGLFIGGTLAVAAYIELSARRGVAAGPVGMRAHGLPLYRRDEPSWDYRRVTDDWATDPRTAELATGGGR